MLYKSCPNCLRIKPVCEFDANRVTPSGFSNWCTSCNRDYGAVRRELNRQRNAARTALGILPAGEKTCPNCGDTYHRATGFYRDRSTDDGASNYCRNCSKAKAKAQRERWGRANDERRAVIYSE